MEVSELPPTRISLLCDEGTRAFSKIDDIRERLQRWTALPVSVLSGSEHPDDAVVLMWSDVYATRVWPLDARRRTILVELERGYEVKQLEAAQTAGGIDVVRYFEWSAGASGGNHVSGLYARRDVLSTMPGPFRLAMPPTFASDNYACVYDAPYPDFAAMIVAYATAVLAMPNK